MIKEKISEIFPILAIGLPVAFLGLRLFTHGQHYVGILVTLMALVTMTSTIEL